MNQDSTTTENVDARIISYADGVYNLNLETVTSGSTAETAKIEISEQQAQRLCNELGLEFPEADRQPVEIWR